LPATLIHLCGTTVRSVTTFTDRPPARAPGPNRGDVRSVLPRPLAAETPWCPQSRPDPPAPGLAAAGEVADLGDGEERRRSPPPAGDWRSIPRYQGSFADAQPAVSCFVTFSPPAGKQGAGPVC